MTPSLSALYWTWLAQVVRLRDDNAALMETLVRTKVELAETQGAPEISTTPCVTLTSLILWRGSTLRGTKRWSAQ